MFQNIYLQLIRKLPDIKQLIYSWCSHWVKFDFIDREAALQFNLRNSKKNIAK